MDRIDEARAEPSTPPLPFTWRAAPELFSHHADKLRLLARTLEQLNVRFALTSHETEPLMVFVVVDCALRELDGVIAQLESRDLGSITSVITLPGYLAMLPHLGNHLPWVLADPSSLLPGG